MNFEPRAGLSADLHQNLLERIYKIPIMGALGFEIVELSAGYCELRAPHELKYNGIFDSLHGGLMMTAADSAAAFALLTLTGPEAHLTTTDMNIRFLAPCLTDLTVKAKVIKHGRTLSPMSVDLFDDDGRHLAVAQVTYFNLG